MSARLHGKACLIVGAATGIGAAVAARFAAEGGRVAVVGWPRPQPVGEGPAFDCDVTDDAAVRATVAAVQTAFGRIDVLVNCAGIVRNDDAADIDDGDWHRLHEVNLGGTMRCQRAVLPGMVAQGGGAIVNIASVAAFNAGAGMASYASSKAGVVALTRSAAQAYGPKGVRVNALCPGWVDTPMSRQEMRDLAAERGIDEDAARAQTVARIALGRMATPEEMAAVCLFLASDEASFVTGVALVADGGARVPAAARAV
ncbi:3-oxoacyl-[acyl-carrier protein] reductase [Variovorax boronicumulans]|uniref:SDR family NAD(P)-dependent oxidoreductase n=1 Tax=Variovorax boronicumulans TaxID=436515 RepID=UPI000BB2F87E|nr:SDR family oxidoreductase [Variovorax boronicumulans]MDP9918800.1 3-oxoacyl-[acyl-carrier protein] reductase [Variovorax boronicumulans]PBI86229.1 Short-chain reductase protein NovJ [Variovorax boronicumulans]